MSNNEYWLEPNGSLRTNFNITTGLKSNEIVKYKSKQWLKNPSRPRGGHRPPHLHRCLLRMPPWPSPPGSAIPWWSSRTAARDPWATYKFGSGGDARPLSDQLLQEPYLMEEFVPSEVTAYDDVCNYRGEVLFCGQSHHK